MITSQNVWNLHPYHGRASTVGSHYSDGVLGIVGDIEDDYASSGSSSLIGVIEVWIATF